MKTKAFTLVELVVVVTILAILTAVSVVSFNGYIVGARDSSRIADAGLIKSNLRSHAQKIGAYPTPSSYSSITNSGATVALQWVLDANVGLANMANIPKDPKVERYYGYSVNKSKQMYQVALTLENEKTPTAYIDGDYKTVAINVLPSLFVAVAPSTTGIEIGAGKTWSGSVGSENRKKFVLQGSDANLLYDMKNQIIAKGLTLASSGTYIIPANYTVPVNTSYISCSEIKDAGRSIWEGEYQIRTTDGNAITSTGCTGVGFSN